MKLPCKSRWLYNNTGIHMWTEDGSYVFVIPIPGTLSQQVADEEADLPDTPFKAFRLLGDKYESVQPEDEDKMWERVENEEMEDDRDPDILTATAKLPLVSVDPETCFTKEPKYISEIETLKKCIGLDHTVQLLGRSENMELVFRRYGRDVWNYLADDRKTINASQKHNILLKTARAVAELHKAGIAHKDLVARNILLTDDCDVFLADLESKHTSFQVKPPEASDGRPVTEKGDVFAFSRFIWTVVNCNQPRPFRTLRVEGLYSSLFEDCGKSNPQERPSMADVVARLDSTRPDE